MPGGVLANRPPQPIALPFGNFKEFREELPFSLRQEAIGGFQVVSQYTTLRNRALVVIQQLLFP
jgi:hypothetical protein